MKSHPHVRRYVTRVEEKVLVDDFCKEYLNGKGQKSEEA